MAVPRPESEEARLAALAAHLADHNANSGLPYCLEISIGLAKASVDDANDILDLINQADAEMYANKRNRKDRSD